MRVILVGLLMVLAGCDRTYLSMQDSVRRPEVVTWQEHLMEVASADLQCPEKDITVAKVGGEDMAKVAGCGRHATYEYEGRLQWGRVADDTFP